MPEGDTWRPTFLPMVSAYREANQSEPEFTNFAHTGVSDTPFYGTLDYIFYNKNAFSVDSVVPLPSFSSMETHGSFPIETEPSDHMLIGVDLVLL